MKKLLTILVAVLVLAGCAGSGQYSKLSNGSEVLFKADGVSYTNDDLYKSLKVSSASVIENDIINSIAKTYDINTDEMEKNAEDTVNQLIEMGLETSIISYYGSLEAYRSMMITSQLMGALAAEMVKADFDETVNENRPLKMQLAEFNSTEEAEAFVAKVNDGSSFDMASLEINENNNPQPFVFVDKNDVVPLGVKEYLNNTDTTGLSTIIPSQKEENGEMVPKYYVANVISRNVEDFKDDYIAIASSYIEDDEVKEYFFAKHNIKFYDQDLYDLMSKENEAFK